MAGRYGVRVDVAGAAAVAATGGQLDIFAAGAVLAPDPTSRIRRFYSGANDIYDAWGVMEAGAAVGVSARDVRGRTLEYLAHYVSHRSGHVFIDSGAFSDGREGRETDFEKAVFPIYDRLLHLIAHPGENPAATDAGAADPTPLRRVFLVAPDQVGDQERSLQLLARHRQKIRRYLSLGVSVIVPLQKGSRSAADVYRLAGRTLGTQDFVVGIPSQDAAFSSSDLEVFLRAVTPTRLHLLGLGTDRRRVIPRLQVLDRLTPGAEVPTDANRLRAHIGAGRRLTEVPRQRVVMESGFEGAPTVEPWSEGKGLDTELDETELAGALYLDVEWMTAAEIRQLAAHLGQDPEELSRHHTDGTLGEWFDSNLCDPRLLDLAIGKMTRAISHARARAEEVTKMIRGLDL